MINNVGFEAVDGSGTVGAAGKAVAIYGWCLAPDEAEAVTVDFYNGTDDTGDVIFGMSTTTTAGRSSIQELGGVGVVFPSGCYLKMTGTLGTATGSIWLQRVSV